VPFGLAVTLLSHQKKTLLQSLALLDKAFAPVPSSRPHLVQAPEARACLVAGHLQNIADHLRHGLDLLEHMLRQQLIECLGRELEPLDFADYLRWHLRLLFLPAYLPQAFHYYIRRDSDHSCEGELRVEAVPDDLSRRPIEPIYCSCSRSLGGPARPILFHLDASTKVTLHGERYLHGWVRTTFDDQAGFSLRLAARARQFGNFVLLVGTLVGAELFEPKYAVIVRDKDEVLVPLLLDVRARPL
jgi:hypothetical protein